MVPLALIVALGGGGALVALGAADRTAGAYDDYLARAGVGDVVINPSLNTEAIDRAIRSLPGVRAITSDDLLLTITDDAATGLTAASNLGQIRSSTDGRYTDLDRPILVAGRYPTGPREAMVNEELAAAEGIELGDVVTLPLGWTRDDLLGLVTEPVGVEQITVVGVGTFFDEVLDDPIYPRQVMILSSDVAERYTCTPPAPPPDATLDDATKIVTPPGCASAYRYYSLALEDGAAGVPAVLDAAQAAAAELTAELPQAVRDEGGGYFVIATTTAEVAVQVERAIRPTVAALAALGVAAGLVTLVVAALAAARDMRRVEHETAQLRELGMGTGERAVVLVVPFVAAAAAGTFVAGAVAWWLSPVGPVGAVRRVDPSPARELAGVAVVSALMLAALLGLVFVALALASSRRAGVRHRRSDVVATRLDPVLSVAPPEMGEGVRAALSGRSWVLVVGSGAIAVAVFVTVLVVATSLSALVRTPSAYGWSWDVAVVGNAGYGPLDLDEVAAVLDERDDVDGWTALSFTGDLAVEGRPLFSMVWDDRGGGDGPTVLEGELPAGDDEVALGRRTAAELGVGVGDSVEVSGFGQELEATVTGLVVFPAIGPFQSDRGSPGTGMLVPYAMIDFDAGFLGVDLDERAGSGAAADVLATLAADFASIDPDGEGYMVRFDRPIRPPEIEDARSIRVLPAVVGGLVALAVLIGLTFSIVVSVRSRRRELAILRSIGFTGRQIRRSVRAQTVATMAAALVLGVPLGLVAGRLTWRAFAGLLGVVPDPSSPLVWLGLTVAGGVVLALAAAAIPARLAAATRPAAGLRAE
jgi:FtsX-like permease family